MCGRLSQTTAADKAARALEIVGELPALPQRYNVAPSLPLAAIRQTEAGRNEWVILRWGLIPHWAKDAKIGYKMINAKAETLAEKPAFRQAVRHRRCVIPADGFYEWKKLNREKQPYYIFRDHAEPMFFAGLWEHWQSDGEAIESCTIVTTDANDLISPLYNRMPAILTAAQADRWLDTTNTDPGSLQDLLQPYDGADLRCHPVSPLVNNPRNDDARCIEPV